MTPARFARVASRIAAAALVVAGSTMIPKEQAKAEPAPTDTQPPVLAIVSPLASPVCSAAGSATLLVPILSGVVQDKLHLGNSLNIGNLILSALGPVYVVCGKLPAPRGTVCQLDDRIAGLWPKDISNVGLLAPGPVGNVVESVNAALTGLGLPAGSPLDSALQCTIRAPANPVPPTAPIVPSGLFTPATAAAPTASSSPSLVSGGHPSLPGPVQVPPALAAPAPSALTSTPTRPGPVGLIHALDHRIPGGLLTLQIMVAALLAAFLTGSWLTSGKLALRRS